MTIIPESPAIMPVSVTAPGALKGCRVIEAEIPLQFGSVTLVRDQFHEPVDLVSPPDVGHVITMTTLPFPGIAEGRFPDHWGARRSTPVGEIFLLPAGHVVHIRSKCRNQNSIVCRFNPQSAYRWFEYDLDWTDVQLQTALDISNPRVRNLLTSIGSEIRAPGFASEAMVELMVAQAAIEISRQLKVIDQDKPIGGLSNQLLKCIDQRLNEGATTPSLTELAELCGLSTRHLARAFRVSRKQSLGSYIAEHRIGMAKRLLATGQCIKSVAYELGFSAPSNFTTAFRKATGETPRQYQVKESRGRSISLAAKLPKH